MWPIPWAPACPSKDPLCWKVTVRGARFLIAEYQQIVCAEAQAIARPSFPVLLPFGWAHHTPAEFVRKSKWGPSSPRSLEGSGDSHREDGPILLPNGCAEIRAL